VEESIKYGDEKIRKLDTSNPLIKITSQLDCITGEDSDEEPRAIMSCGHAFTAITMYTYIQHCFQNDFSHYEFFCPVKNCRKLWDWDVVACVGDVTDDEFNKFSNLIEERQFKKGLIKICPHCRINIDRPQELNQNCVQCICKGPNFCYTCLKKWNHSGLQICGNVDCETHTIEDNIKSCKPVSTTGYLDDQTMPQMRACPKCLTIITYEKNCKRVVCPRKDCSYDFCFACLTKWPCSSGYNKVCKAAPKQEL